MLIIDLPMPSPQTETSNTPPGNFSGYSSFEVADAIIIRGEQEIRELFDRERVEGLDPDSVDFETKVIMDIGGRVMRLAELDGVNSGEDLIGEITREARQLRGAPDHEFMPSDRLRNRPFRHRVMRRLLNLTSSLPEDIFPPTVQDPSDAETKEKNSLVQEIVDISHNLGGTGLYGDVDGRGLSTITQGNSLAEQSPSRTTGKATLGIWQNINTGPQTRRFEASGKIEDVFAEALAFTPTAVQKDVVVEEAQESSLFRRAKPAVTRRQTEAKIVEGPQGPEPSVIIWYRYEPYWGGHDAANALVQAGAADYREAGGGRPHNTHAFAVEVPKSVAERFREAILQDHTLPRQLGDALVQRYAPESYKDAWNKEKGLETRNPNFRHHYYPTYNTLPNGVPLHVYDALGTDPVRFAKESSVNPDLFSHTEISHRT